MTNLQAALGVAQLEQLDQFLEKKRWIGERYNLLFADCPGVKLPLANTDFAENIYWVFGLVIEDSSGFDARDVLSKLAAQGVGCRPFFYPMHQQPVFKEMGLFPGKRLPVAERLYDLGFYIPSGLALNESQIKCVSDSLKNIFQTVIS